MSASQPADDETDGEPEAYASGPGKARGGAAPVERTPGGRTTVRRPGDDEEQDPPGGRALQRLRQLEQERGLEEIQPAGSGDEPADFGGDEGCQPADDT